MTPIIAPHRNSYRIRHAPVTPRFEVGQAVRLTVRPGMSARTGNIYRVSRVLPLTENSVFQYRIASDDDGNDTVHERVTTEDDLEAIDLAHVLNAATLRDRVFARDSSS